MGKNFQERALAAMVFYNTATTSVEWSAGQPPFGFLSLHQNGLSLSRHKVAQGAPEDTEIICSAQSHNRQWLCARSVLQARTPVPVPSRVQSRSDTKNIMERRGAIAP